MCQFRVTHTRAKYHGCTKGEKSGHLNGVCRNMRKCTILSMQLHMPSSQFQSTGLSRHRETSCVALSRASSTRPSPCTHAQPGTHTQRVGTACKSNTQICKLEKSLQHLEPLHCQDKNQRYHTWRTDQGTSAKWMKSCIPQCQPPPRVGSLQQEHPGITVIWNSSPRASRRRSAVQENIPSTSKLHGTH